MLRFRTTADENLYLALRTELYVAAAQLGDPQMTSLIMRNFGKLEALVHMEGVRQGLACAVLSEGMPGLAEQRPSAVLAHVYGDAATPLVRVENLRWEGKGEKPAWLDATESTFPAMTYAEAMGIEQPKPPMYRVDAPHAPTPVPTRTPKPSDDELSRLFDENDEPPTPASPEQLAHYRDAMVAMKSDGVAIGSWSELMLTLALRLGEDAGFIDLALGTESGRLVLQQAGYGDLQPGSAVVMDRFVGEIPGQAIDVLPKPPAPEETPASPPPDAVE